MRRHYPCGTKARSCGPVGQSAEQVARYLRAIARAVPHATVQAIDIVAAEQEGEGEPAAVAIFRQHGPAALPIVCNELQVLAFAEPDPERLARRVAAGVADPAKHPR
jgi:hypothetical protein